MLLKKIEIFTDGSCLGNPGPGGYGVILRYKTNELTLSDGYMLTTNNRMELMAAIVGLERLTQRCDCKLYTDSQYVRHGISQWIFNWKKNGWLTANKKPVKNIDLWQRLDRVLQKQQVEWIWVKGHSGHLENERCDQLAREEANNPKKYDEGFKKENE